jgi:hypothetical protein
VRHIERDRSVFLVSDAFDGVGSPAPSEPYRGEHSDSPRAARACEDERRVRVRGRVPPTQCCKLCCGPECSQGPGLLEEKGDW